VPDTARNIEDLVAKARQADAEVAAVRADAVHAGDADPYRQPADRADSGDEDEFVGNDLVEDQFDDDDLDDEGVTPGPLGNYPGPAARGGRSAGR
jgi:ribosome-binding factor A